MTKAGSILEKFIYEAEKFSFVKALDVAQQRCEMSFVDIKSNVNYTSKYIDVSKVEGIKDGLAEIHVNMNGIIGIESPIPDSYTEEFLSYDRTTRGALCDYFDIYNSKILSLRYAFLKRQNIETLSSPIENSVIGNIIFSLSGFEFNTHSKTDIIPEQFKVSVQNLFWRHTRSSSGLKTVLESFFKVPIEIRQFEGGFIQAPIGERMSIGTKGRYNKLGENSLLGDKVWDATKGITILIGALDFEQYTKFLPKKSSKDRKFSSLQKMKEIIRLYVPHGIDVHLHFFLDQCLVRETLLNGDNRLNKDTFILGLHSSKSAFFIESV